VANRTRNISLYVERGSMYFLRGSRAFAGTLSPYDLYIAGTVPRHRLSAASGRPVSHGGTRWRGRFLGACRPV
jgi:hypothetical protein